MEAGKARQEDSAHAAVRRARASVARAQRVTGAVAIGAAVLATGVAISTAYLPIADGIPTEVRAGATLAEGPAHLGGRYRIGRVARLHEEMILARRTTYVAPVQLLGARSDDRAPAQVLTTMLPRAEGGFMPVTSGVLVRRGTPRALHSLYAAAGTPIAADGFLMMRDEAQVGWRRWVLAAQFAAVSLLTALAWQLSRRRGVRLARLDDAQTR